MTEQRVLVVDDDGYGQEVVSKMLQFHHIEADMASSAEEALAKMRDYAYNLIVIDLALPKMDGWSLLQHIREKPDWATLPCVAITAYHDATVARDALKAGFTAYMAKPLQTSFAHHLMQFLRDYSS